MKIKNQKGMSTVISTLLYILIAIIILGVVTYSAMELLDSVKEQSNYKTMLESMTTLKTVIEDVVDDKKDIEIVVKNPGEIIIDCENNMITGEIDYLGKYKDEIVMINDIATHKNNNIIYFEYNLDNYKRLMLDCNDFIISNKKTTLNIKYQEYNDENDQILINIECVECRT
jgi:archaellum component FlaG (FlaF/FlaG flagellin family)